MVGPIGKGGQKDNEERKPHPGLEYFLRCHKSLSRIERLNSYNKETMPLQIRSVIFMVWFLACAGARAQTDNPILAIRILEKQNPQELEIQCPPGRGPWSQIKLSRGIWSVNGKALRE